MPENKLIRWIIQIIAVGVLCFLCYSLGTFRSAYEECDTDRKNYILIQYYEKNNIDPSKIWTSKNIVAGMGDEGIRGVNDGQSRSKK